SYPESSSAQEPNSSEKILNKITKTTSYKQHHFSLQKQHFPSWKCFL
ncbi:MAG: hypothetical protein ACJAQX_002203, partial [Polaribacter sp.]